MNRSRLAAGIIALGLWARPAPAQVPRATAEFRVDALVSTHTAIEAGGSVILPGGVYMRTAITGATGLTWRNGATAAVSRGEVTSRFLLDPFREAAYGLSVGGGLGITNETGARWRPYLALLIDLELKRAGGLTPAIQAGLGGGARLGLVLRTASDRWR